MGGWEPYPSSPYYPATFLLPKARGKDGGNKITEYKGEKMLTFNLAPTDYTFNISVSTTNYTSKEDFKKASASLTYEKRLVNLNDFCQLIKAGHSFCHCYDDNDEPFDNSVKTKANFRYTSYMAFDIDDSSMPMEEYLTTLTYQPTIAYTTTSDGLEGKGYRYRLVYCFDGKIKGVQQYESVFWKMKEECGIVELKDTCTRGTHQPIFGNALPTGRLICSDLVYQIPTTKKGTHTKPRTDKKVPKQTKIERDPHVIVYDDTFLKDFYELALWEFVCKYCKYYPLVVESMLQFKDGYAEIDENYVKVYRAWDKEKRRIRIWQDGENRRRKLSITALLIRKIKPDITPEHLVYCLAYEVVHYYDNSDEVLNQDFILRVAKSTISKPIEEISLKGRDRRKFAIDKDYWESLGISPHAAVPIVRAMRNDIIIGNLYDASLTDKENLKVMEKYGHPVSLSALKRWRKRHGISKYNKNKVSL